MHEFKHNVDVNLEIELNVALEIIREAEEAFAQLRKEYQELRQHTNQLEKILAEKGIEYPRYWGG